MHNTLQRLTVALICLCSATPSAAVAHVTDLWVLVTGHMCVAQDAKYEQTPFGQKLMQFWAERGGFESHPSTACFRERRWASEGLCADVTAIEEGTRASQLDALYDKHKEELARMSRLAGYLKGYLSRTPSLPCPEKL